MKIVSKGCASNEAFLCAYKKKYVGPCKGDSGSGLVFRNKLVGLLLHGDVVCIHTKTQIHLPAYRFCMIGLWTLLKMINGNFGNNYCINILLTFGVAIKGLLNDKVYILQRTTNVIQCYKYLEICKNYSSND